MFLKALASIILCFSFIFGSIPGISLPEVPKKAEFVSASFDGYVITLADGVLLDLRVSGPDVIFTSSEDRHYNITLFDIENNRVIRNFSEGGESFSVEMASYMNEETLYYIMISYDALDFEFTNGNNVIFKKGNNVCFWKNSTYDYNLGSTSEMWTDEQSLRECLQPQNDVECDDPVLIGYSEQICNGASNDWEKVFRIYRYIAAEMAYDNEEANADSAGYQDGAVCVLRDGKGICEGFANVFTALCRAQGIPAVVEFGMGYADYDEMTTRIPTTDELADHAWAAVYLGERWQFVDPTFDMSRYYNGDGDIDVADFTTYYYLLPLESFSNDHLIMDADTIHGIPSAGHCGNYADYEITRDGVCHIYGSGGRRPASASMRSHPRSSTASARSFSSPDARSRNSKKTVFATAIFLRS